MSESNYSNLLNKLISIGVEESEAKREIVILKEEIKDPEQIKRIIQERIKTRKPIQHLIGKAYFMDFEVKVTPDVLIPRPETEILVEEAVTRLQAIDNGQRTTSSKHRHSILDIGTGSGVIPIGLCKMLPDATVTSIDISSKALKIAEENAKSNKVNSQITFKEYDIFSKSVEEIFANNSFDLIISNPPYIKEDEVSNLEPEVSLHEPKIALSGSKENTSGLIYYERILELSKKNKKEHSLIALEIDPPIANGIKQLLKKHDLSNYEILKDYDKLDRCLFIQI